MKRLLLIAVLGLSAAAVQVFADDSSTSTTPTINNPTIQSPDDPHGTSSVGGRHFHKPIDQSQSTSTS